MAWDNPCDDGLNTGLSWPTRSGAAAIADLIQIIYSSQPFGFDDAVLNGILVDARRCNIHDDVTGALICRHDIYLQLLEGPTQAVQDTLARIKRDDRHLEVEIQSSKPVDARLFGEWAMLHDPAKTWIWTAEEVANGALDDATPAEFQAVFETLAASAKAET